MQFYLHQRKERLSTAAGDQKALWRISKDLLHNDDRPPDAGTLEAKLLCDGFSVFFADKLKLIASTVCTRLQGVDAYYLQPTCRKSPTLLGSHGGVGVTTDRCANSEDVDTRFHAHFADEVMRRCHGSCHRRTCQ